MPEGVRAAPNPHALAPAAAVSARLTQAPAALAATAAGGGEASWPLRLGHVWPGIPALRGPRHPTYDLNGGPHGLESPSDLRRLLDASRWPAGWPRLLAANAVTAEGPAWDALQTMAAEGLIDLHVLARWDRALLDRGAAPDAEAYGERFLSGDQRKALRRKRRRLAEAGALALELHEEPRTMSAAFETFCRLEAAGWKGGRGTALAQDAAGRAYVEAVLLAMAEQQGAFAAVLSAGADPVAAGLFLRSGGEVLFWKTAYDERLARHSPGVVFDLMLTEWLYRQPWFERLDAGHDDSVAPATLIWRQRRPMANLLIDLRPGSLRGRLALAGMTLRGRLRALKAS